MPETDGIATPFAWISIQTECARRLCEIKPADDVEDPVVQKKELRPRSGSAVSMHATDYSARPWSCALIPHNEVRANNSLMGLVKRFRAD